MPIFLKNKITVKIEPREMDLILKKCLKCQNKYRSVRLKFISSFHYHDTLPVNKEMLQTATNSFTLVFTELNAIRSRVEKYL